MASKKPSWLNQQEYPFKSKHMDLTVGKMHYIDEGSGETILFVHGNPSWSFEYRHAIKKLSGKFRCIAIDHIGFGFSDKPADWDYRAESHAQNLEAFIFKLKLTSFSLVLHDWGGPIGISYALKFPDKVKKMVVSNSWFWPVNRNLKFFVFSKLAGGFLGKVLSERMNLFARYLIRIGFVRQPKPVIFNHYYAHLARGQRKGTWVFPKEITNSGGWLKSLWEKREKISDKPLLLLWGTKDPVFRKAQLKKWQLTFPRSKTVLMKRSGHFPPEEEPDHYSDQLLNFFSSNE